MKFSKHIHKFNTNEIIELISKGLNNRQISEEVEIPQRILSEMLKHFNIENKNKRYIKNINHDYFNNIDNENKAYILGFLLADGCVLVEPKKKNGKIYSYSKRISFCNSISDYEIIEKIRNEISPQSNIKIFQNNKGTVNRKPQCVLRIGSSEIVDKLIDIDIKPRKTEDLNFKFDFSIIPEHLIRHFIRGFFDGDGWVGRGKYKQMGFVTTYLIFCEQLQNHFSNVFPEITSNITTCKSKNMFTYSLTLNISGKKPLIIFDYFYNNSNIFLMRKYKNFIQDNTVLTSEIAKGSEAV